MGLSMSDLSRLIEVVEAYRYFLQWGSDNGIDIPSSFHERALEAMRIEVAGEDILSGQEAA